MEIEQGEKYTLSQVFKQNQRSVRCVDAKGQYLITGSEDTTVNIYQKIDNKYVHRNTVNMFDKMIYAVKVRNDGKGFFVGCQDKNAYVLDEEGNPLLVLEGHTHTVNSISQVDENHIATGSWDGTAKIWNIQDGKCIRTFEGHSYAVSVLALQSLDILITGSQDKSLKIFQLSSGALQKEIKNAHNDIIRQLSFVENVGFLSCSNDELIKLWSFDGDSLSQCVGHKGFVFTVDCISFGKYVSAGDDRFVNIWNDQNQGQSIEHPNSLWGVSAHESGDIITACADGVVRVFSQDLTKQATELEQKEFEAEVAVVNEASKSSSMSQDEINKLPTDPNAIKGTKNGEYKMFREGNVVNAYMWNGDEQKWDKVGEVTGTGGGSGGQLGKKYYQGDMCFKAGEYDYIFDVQDDSGQYKQLPFNEGESTFISARMYCSREGLSLGYQSQIEKFLNDNTQAGRQRQQQQELIKQAQAGQTSGISTNLGQAFEQPQKQRVGPVKSNFFPNLQPFKFTAINKEALINKAKENNEKLKEDEANKQIIIQNIELKRFESIVDFAADTGNQAKLLDTAQWDMLNLKLLKWPEDLRIPVYDLLRMLMLHPQSEKFFTGLDSGMYFLLDVCTLIQSQNTKDGVVSLLMKLLSNTFQTSNGSMGLQRNYKIICDALREANKRNNANVRNSLTSLLVNYSIDIAQRVKGGQAKTINDYVVEISKLCVDVLQNPDNTTDSEFRVLVALGNLLDGMGKVVKPIVNNGVNSYNHKGGDKNVNELLGDVKALLQQIQ